MNEPNKMVLKQQIMYTHSYIFHIILFIQTNFHDHNT